MPFSEGQLYPSQHTMSQGTSPERPLKILTSETYKGLSGDSQGTNTKINDLMKKLFFRSNSLCITYLFVFFTGRANTQKLKMGTSLGRLREPVAGRPGDVRGTSVKHAFKFNSQTH